MKLQILTAAIILATSTISAKTIEIPGMYISTSTTTSPEGSEIKVKITCALVSTDKCYTATIPDKSTINPIVVDGELDPEDQYTQIEISNGDVFTGQIISHYQNNILSETGQIYRVHTLTITP